MEKKNCLSNQHPWDRPILGRASAARIWRGISIGAAARVESGSRPRECVAGSDLGSEQLGLNRDVRPAPAAQRQLLFGVRAKSLHVFAGGASSCPFVCDTALCDCRVSRRPSSWLFHQAHAAHVFYTRPFYYLEFESRRVGFASRHLTPARLLHRMDV